MPWNRQAIFESKEDKLSSSAECRIWTWKSQDTYSPADRMPTHKPTELSGIKLKTWPQQPVSMMSEHSYGYEVPNGVNNHIDDSNYATSVSVIMPNFDQVLHFVHWD